MSVSQQTLNIAQTLIKQGQKYKDHIYLDDAKEENPTIYYGHKVITGQKFNNTKEEGQKIFKADLKIASKAAAQCYGEGWEQLSKQRQAVIIDMAYNQGIAEIKNYKNMISSLKDKKFDAAAMHLLDSKYRWQVKNRSYRNAYILKFNKIITKQQGQQKALQEGVLTKNKHHKVIYGNTKEDARIKKILDAPKTDADVAKQLDKIKKAKIGGVSFDFDPCLARLSGVVIDNDKVRVVAGDAYDLANFGFMDLVVPLKIMYDTDIKSKNISVSLDPWVLSQPDGPWYRKVFYPKQLTNTEYGQDMIQADYLMKQLSLGVNQNNDPYPYSEEELKMGIDIQSIFKHVQQVNYAGSRTRLWIVIKDYQVVVNQRFFQVGKVKMGVQLKALEIGDNGSLKDCNDDPSPISKRFAELFTKHYDELAEIYPILNRMKRLAKASIIAKLMFFKRVPVDMDLINRLYKKQISEFEEKLPRLSNKLEKQGGNKIIQMSVLGGCSFDISNMQQKITTLQKQIKQTRQFFQKKHLNSNTVPLKSFQSNGIGQFIFIKDQQDRISNSPVYPFLFQNIVTCKHCDRPCNLDYYSVTNRECVQHSSMKCKICQELVMPGDKYKSNQGKTMVFHQRCFVCTGCKKIIQGSFAKVDGGQYHPDCVPKKSIGKCDECKKQIFQNEPYAQNPQTSAVYHGECAKKMNQRILDSMPKCKHCGIKLQGQYVKYKNESYHEQCAKKLFN